MVDIKKALIVKRLTNLYIKLLRYFYEFLDIFNYIKADKLPPL
jgi:hypothetical protein